MKKQEKKIENTEYKHRTPIILNNNAVAHIYIFTKHDDLEDIWMFDTEYMLHNLNGYEGAAQEFIDQLKDEWCDAFIESLALKLIETYKESRSRTGSDSGFKELINKINKI